MIALFDQVFSGFVSAVKIVQQDFIDGAFVQVAFDQDTVYGLIGDTAKKFLILPVTAVGDDAVCASLREIVYVFHAGVNVFSTTAKQHVVPMFFTGILETVNQVEEKVMHRSSMTTPIGHGLLQHQCPGKAVWHIVVFSMVSRILRRFSGLTPGLLLRTLDTRVLDTLASFAISDMVAIAFLLKN